MGSRGCTEGRKFTEGETSCLPFVGCPPRWGCLLLGSFAVPENVCGEEG